jgi:hypothetical protein
MRRRDFHPVREADGAAVCVPACPDIDVVGEDPERNLIALADVAVESTE